MVQNTKKKKKKGPKRQTKKRAKDSKIKRKRLQKYNTHKIILTIIKTKIKQLKTQN